MKSFVKNILIIIFSIVLMYILVDITSRFRREHFGVETSGIRAANDRRFRSKDDVYNSHVPKVLYDMRQHVLSNDFKKYFYFSEIDIPNRIMKRAVKNVFLRSGRRDKGFLNYNWTDVSKRNISKRTIERIVTRVLRMINNELPRGNLDEYYKPQMTSPAKRTPDEPNPTPNPSAVGETMPTTPAPTTTPRPTRRTTPRPTLGVRLSQNISDFGAHLSYIRNKKDLRRKGGWFLSPKLVRQLKNYKQIQGFEDKNNKYAITYEREYVGIANDAYNGTEDGKQSHNTDKIKFLKGHKIRILKRVPGFQSAESYGWYAGVNLSTNSNNIGWFPIYKKTDECSEDKLRDSPATRRDCLMVSENDHKFSQGVLNLFKLRTRGSVNFHKRGSEVEFKVDDDWIRGKVVKRTSVGRVRAINKLDKDEEPIIFKNNKEYEEWSQDKKDRKPLEGGKIGWVWKPEEWKRWKIEYYKHKTYEIVKDGETFLVEHDNVREPKYLKIGELKMPQELLDQLDVDKVLSGEETNNKYFKKAEENTEEFTSIRSCVNYNPDQCNYLNKFIIKNIDKIKFVKGNREYPMPEINYEPNTDQNGNILSVTYLRDGSVRKVDGTIITASGVVIKPDGTTIKPDESESFSGQRLIEHYYDYESARRYIEYYKLHHFKIVSVRRYRNMYRWVVNMYIYRKDKSTMFVVQMGAMGSNNNFKIVKLDLISRESVDKDFLENGYDDKIEPYKYIYEDPNSICNMPAIFRESGTTDTNNNTDNNSRGAIFDDLISAFNCVPNEAHGRITCKMLSATKQLYQSASDTIKPSNDRRERISPECKATNFNHVDRNRVPDYVTSDQRKIREILDARAASYQGFFRPVRFSFGEEALQNATIQDDVVERTNRRFLDRI